MYTLKVRMHFDAAHKLENYSGPCANVHGHRWEVIFTFGFNKLNEIGMGVDFKDVKTNLEDVLPDHQYLNEVLSFNPTAENIACYLFHQVNKFYANLKSVEVFESPDCSCVYNLELEQ